MPRNHHLTPGIISRFLGVKHETVIRWIQRGHLPAINITSGSKPVYRIFRKDLSAFMQKRGLPEGRIQELLAEFPMAR